MQRLTQGTDDAPVTEYDIDVVRALLKRLEMSRAT